MTNYYLPSLLKELHQAEQNGDKQQIRLLRSRIAMNIGSPQALRVALGIDPEEFNDFYGDMQAANLSTEDTIETFLTQYSHTPQTDELQYAPAIDYATSFLQQNDSQAPLASPGELAASLNAPVETTPALLSEQLAGAMIKNKNYSKALEIIQELSLKNPQKSVYFADQMRFLRKVIYAQNQNS